MVLVSFDELSDVKAFNWIALLSLGVLVSCPSQQLKLLAEM